MVYKAKPIPLVMVICDSVLQDVATGKKSLVSLFDIISFEKMPACAPKFNVFVKLTEGQGECSCELRCINASTGEIIAKLMGPITFNDPHHIIDFNFELNNLIFPSFGDYRFEFLCENNLITACKFQVIKTNQNNSNKNEK